MSDITRTLWYVERQYIERILVETKGNKTEAARILGITLKTIYNKLESYRKHDEAMLRLRGNKL